jgi:hypothetical protein
LDETSNWWRRWVAEPNLIATRTLGIVERSVDGFQQRLDIVRRGSASGLAETRLFGVIVQRGAKSMPTWLAAVSSRTLAVAQDARSWLTAARRFCTMHSVGARLRPDCQQPRKTGGGIRYAVWPAC